MKEIIPSLIALADHLDKKGFSKEADFADSIVQKIVATMTKEEPAEEVKEEESPEKKDMMPMKSDDVKEDEMCAAKDAEANLKLVQMRRRARQRRMLVKES